MDEAELFDPIYKGCLSPPMTLGLPMIPFLLSALLFGLVAFYALFLFGVGPALMVVLGYAALYMWARRVTRQDDHRLVQMMLRFRMRSRQLPNKGRWGAISFGPMPKARK